MWPFKRKDKSADSTVPAELQHYYKSEHRERIGLAWLVAFMSLVVTVAVVFGAFYGGRWTYRKVTHKNGNSIDQPAGVSQKPEVIPGPTDQKTTSNPTLQGSNSSAATTLSTPTTSSTQGSNKSLVNTGPGNTLAIFVATTVVGAVLHSLVMRQKRARTS